jgi:hypothetical protein
MPRKVIFEETMCCGYKRCPKVRVFSDGSVELSDDDARAGSVGTVKLKPRVAKELARIIEERTRK